MLVKIDLPAQLTPFEPFKSCEPFKPSSSKVEKLLHPILFQFIQSVLGKWDISCKVWLISDSYIIVKFLSTHDKMADCSTLGEKCKIQEEVKLYNLYNKRLFRLCSVSCSLKMWETIDVASNSGSRYGSELVIYRQIDTFQQNDTGITRQIRNFVNRHLHVEVNLRSRATQTLYGLGGEFYLYFLLNKEYYHRFFGVSNSTDILNIARTNLANYLRPENYNLELVRYDTLTPSVFQNTSESSLIINLSSIPVNIFELLGSKLGFLKIILITCNQTVFNKRRHLLERTYKLIDFEHVPSKVTSVIVSIYVYLRK